MKTKYKNATTNLILLGLFLTSLCAIFMYSSNKEGMRLCQEAGYSKEQCVEIIK